MLGKGVNHAPAKQKTIVEREHSEWHKYKGREQTRNAYQEKFKSVHKNLKKYYKNTTLTRESYQHMIVLKNFVNIF